MVMEAMRLSLLEHEEQQKREAEQKNQEAQSQANADAPATPSNARAAPSVPSTSAPMDIARNATSSRLASLVPPSDQTPSSFSSSPGSQPMPSARVSALRNRSPSPLPGSASEGLSGVVASLLSFPMHAD